MKRTFSLALVLGVPVAVAACGSTSASTAPTTVPAPTSATAGKAVSVGTESSKYGDILDANGKTLYSFSIDTATASKCTSTSCTAVWPPLLGPTAPGLGSGVSQSLVGHITRSSGAQQLTYGGHPLYFFKGDTSAGQTNGEGVVHFGGTWYVVSASTGQPVTTPSSSTSSKATSTTSGYGGY